MANDPVAVTIPDACRALGLGRTKVYALINSGELKGVKIGGRRVVTFESIRRLVENAA